MVKNKMISIKERFDISQLKQPHLSDFISFAEAVSGQGYSRKNIVREFGKLVSKDDYDKKDKRTIISQLVDLSTFQTHKPKKTPSFTHQIGV